MFGQERTNQPWVSYVGQLDNTHGGWAWAGRGTISRGYPTLTAKEIHGCVRLVVTVRLLWPSDEAVAHSEGASRHVHQGGASTRQQGGHIYFELSS